MMDIYLVNSGKLIFFDPTPPLRNALYRNNRDGTFTDVTAKAGVAGGGYGPGRGGRGLRWRWVSGHLRSQYGRNILYHNNGDGHIYRRHGQSWCSCSRVVSSAALVWTMTNDGRLGFVCLPIRRFSKAQKQDCRAGEDAKRGYCIPHLSTYVELAVSQQWRWTLPTPASHLE